MRNAEIRNFDAYINRHLDEVLIGMNTPEIFSYDPEWECRETGRQSSSGTTNNNPA